MQTCLLLVLMGGAYFALMRWTEESMQLVSKGAGVVCILLAFGLILGNYDGFAWLTHLWVQRQTVVVVDTPPSVSSLQPSILTTKRERRDSTITQSIIDKVA